MASFSDSVIVITGASSGIGRALAVRLAADRPKLVLAARDRARLDEVAIECRERGAEALVAPTDVTDPSQCHCVVEQTVRHFGRLNVLVNNAGRAMWCRFDELTDLSVMEDIMRLNYLGSVSMTQAALPHLKASRGLVVGVASIAGLIGVPLLTGYSASKHAVIGFYDSLRIELARSGVGVTVVAPDFVQSEILARALGPDGKPLKMSPLDQKALLSADACAKRIVRAIARRERLAFTSERSKFARWGQILLPKLVDWIAAASVGGR